MGGIPAGDGPKTWAPDYVSPEVLKAYLRIEDTADDVFIDLWITSCSRNVDDYCQRQFGQAGTAEVRYYPTVYDRHEGAWYAETDDIQDTAGLTFADSSGNVTTSYTLYPRNAAAKGKPYERVKLTSWSGGELTGTGLWGWADTPSAVSVGMLLQASRLAARRDSPFGIAGSPSEGSEIRLLAQLDPDFRTTLKPLRREWWAR